MPKSLVVANNRRDEGAASMDRNDAAGIVLTGRGLAGGVASPFRKAHMRASLSNKPWYSCVVAMEGVRRGFMEVVCIIVFMDGVRFLPLNGVHMQPMQSTTTKTKCNETHNFRSLD